MMDDSLWHPVPRLDAPDRVWLLPAPQAKWLAAGIFTGPLVAQLLVFFGGEDPAGVWSLLALWLVWGLGVLCGILGAFYRPGGLHLGQWAAVAVNWLLVPRRATWRPIGGKAWTG